MSKSKVATIAVLGIIGVLVAALILPALQRAKAYSGPGVSGNLWYIAALKTAYQEEHTNEWPSHTGLVEGWAGHNSINEMLRPRYDEIYIINRTGAPPLAYFPKTSRQYEKGGIYCLTSNGMELFTNQVDMQAWAASGITRIPRR